MNLEGDGEECTADPGVMGHNGCHRFPGCGCHGETNDNKEPENKQETTYIELDDLQVGNRWVVIDNLPNVTKICKGKFMFENNGVRYSNGRPIRGAVKEGSLVLMREDVHYFKSLGDIFNVREKIK